jgi:Tfp pilus assembly protein PilZ
MDVKDDLKKIIHEHLGSIVSAHFLEKSFAIIDESANNKESFLAAADRIGKRIALFIDTDLSTKVADVLMMEIENRELTPGSRRKYARVSLSVETFVTYNGMRYKLHTGNLSQGGMFIKTTEPFPAGSEVKISFSHGKESRIHVKGVVVYTRLPSSDMTTRQPGMAIKFIEVGNAERKILISLAKGG